MTRSGPLRFPIAALLAAAACGSPVPETAELREARAAMLFTVASQFREDAATLGVLEFEPVDFRDRWPDELSGGQRQRVGLARALAADPPLLLMDEPFGALDPITRSDLHAEFTHVKTVIARTVIIVTHDITEAFQLADRVAVLHEGRIIACAPGAELRRSNDPRVAALVATRPGSTKLQGSEVE